MKNDDLTALAVAVGVLEEPASRARCHRPPLEHISPSAAHTRAVEEEAWEPTWKTVCGALMIIVTVWAWTLLLWVLGGAV